MNADNTNWIQLFDITEINKHQRGFVIYKVISILYPKRCPEAVTKLSVWKRYNDFKKLYRDMKILHGNYNLPDKFPSLCRGTFFKKYDEHSITEKKQSALNFLEYIGSHHQLFTSKEFVKFFETSYMPINHLNGNISSIKADLNLPDDPEFVRNSDDELNSDSDSISTLSSVNLLDTSSSSLISDRLARNASSRTPGSPQSLQILKNGRTHSEVCSNEDDFMKYVEELETNGNYEEAHKTCVTATDFLRESLSNENDYDKKRSIQHRIELCCLRAERLYNMYLSPEVKNLLSKVDPVIKRSSIQKPAISEIYKYNVIRKEESGMLVLHPDTQKKFYVKVINKTTSFSDDNLIIPESIPYMVQLHNFYNCDNSIFLILEYVKGSKLSDYLNKVRLKFENNETVENLYDKAVDLDIPDDDSENSFTDLVTKYTKVKTDIESNDFEVISKDDISQTVHPVSLPQTESTFSYRQRSSSIPTINIEAEQNVDLLHHEIIVKWAAQLILALEKLHTLGIICKDLRLHNLLINEKGNLTLTYMCNAKDSYDIFINKRDLNLAPEVQGIGPEGEEADWWSFGAIFYEILVGMSINDLHPEYFHQTTILRIPKYVSPEGRSLLRQLLVYEPKKRLGAGPHGVDNLKSHPFFKGIDWNALLEQSFN
ncbi:ribosomal protein S6 kinase delta-1 [Harmonia axyridis]|uniref:ribosomal protein S6 kinase delta-1 n=1 Tax=Harmonia axyridis TaxID=115357 RepID=UPI001E278E6E|nr:ribosomal protein S6 kinase delta-1 [Harmonia axyridis]XP_045464264.1 ribosomal protein S6 kinase delta-1 [Harmonia axyridis]